MNERLKFRVWDNQLKMYMDCVHLFIRDDGKLCDSDAIPIKMDENIIVEFCTGLKDKHGKLIYEGDKILCRHTRKGKEYDDYFVVVYDHDAFCLKQLYDNELYPAVTLIAFGSHKNGKQNKEEIIGNIREVKP